MKSNLRVYIEVEKANKEIQNILSLNLVPYCNLKVINRINYYSIGWLK